MKSIYYLLLICLTVSCKKPGKESITNNADVSSGYSVNLESARKAIHISEQLMQGKTISKIKWDQLFALQGYKHYLVYADSLKKKAILKECFQLVFDPKMSNKRDSLLELPLAMNGQFFKLFILQNINEVRLKLTTARSYLESTNFQVYIQKADSLAKRYLPNDIDSKRTKLYPVFVAMVGPDGQVGNESIVMDLNLMMKLGDEGVVKFLTHEFHHAYRKIHTPEYQSPLMLELNRIHQEGLADLIDKRPPPNYMTEFLPPFLVEIYKTVFYNTPQILEQLDHMVSKDVRGEISQEDLNKQLRGYFKFGGHPNGYYMALKIKEQLGIQVLIDSYNNPIAFLRLYQKAVKKETGKHPFSREFINYLETVK